MTSRGSPFHLWVSLSENCDEPVHNDMPATCCILWLVALVVSSRRASSTEAGGYQLHLGAGRMATAGRGQQTRDHSRLPGGLPAGDKPQLAGRVGRGWPWHLAGSCHRSTGQYHVPVPSGSGRPQGCRWAQQTATRRHQGTRSVSASLTTCRHRSNVAGGIIFWRCCSGPLAVNTLNK